MVNQSWCEPAGHFPDTALSASRAQRYDGPPPYGSVKKLSQNRRRDLPLIAEAAIDPAHG